jgi:hypothetical protein
MRFILLRSSPTPFTWFVAPGHYPAEKLTQTVAERCIVALRWALGRQGRKPEDHFQDVHLWSEYTADRFLCRQRLTNY